MNTRKALLVIVSGPSGSGKTTLCQNIRAVEPLYYTTSCTTRPQRPGEVHGEHYFFLTDSEFSQKVATGEMLEHATVHGRSYGTLKAEVLPRLRAGQDVIMDLDTQGAAQIRACTDAEIEAARVDVFILPTTAETFRQRLAARDSESAEQVELRMRNAREEMKHWREYDYALVSGTREEDLTALRTILAAERMKADRLITADADEV
jgi:guanylate kinase